MFIFLLINVLCILMVKLTLIRVPCPKSWHTWLTIHHYPDDPTHFYFQVPRIHLSKSGTFLNLTHLLHYILIIYYYGNQLPNFTPDPNSNLITNPNQTHVLSNMLTTNLYYATILPLTVAIFGFIGLIKGMNFTITYRSLKHLSRPAKLTLFLLTLLLITLHTYHIQFSPRPNIYLLKLTLIPLTYIFIYWYYLPQTNHHWHIHHWFFGYFHAYLFNLSTPISRLAFYAFYGIFLQGAIAYKISPIIY